MTDTTKGRRATIEPIDEEASSRGARLWHKGLDIEMRPLDEDHVRAKITWSEQDVGGGKLVLEITVRNMKTHPRTDEQLTSDAKALAVRFARAFADTVDN